MFIVIPLLALVGIVVIGLVIADMHSHEKKRPDMLQHKKKSRLQGIRSRFRQ